MNRMYHSDNLRHIFTQTNYFMPLSENPLNRLRHSYILSDTMTLLKNRRVLVVGLGLFGGGAGVTRFLVREGASVTVTDLRSAADLKESVEALAGLPVTLKLGGHDEADFRSSDLIVANPAVPRRSKYLGIAEAAGVPITTEINLFFERCRAHILGVTGSSGKTTTTLLAGEMLRLADPRTRIGGNLGRPLVEEADAIPPDAPVVLELSSFQLDRLRDLRRSPHVAVVTNLAPNHLDVHGSVEAYITAKQGIIAHQAEEDTAVLNADDAEVSRWDRLCAGRVLRFSLDREVELGTFLQAEQIVGRLKDRIIPVCPVRDLLLPGRHNVANALAATAAALAWGVDPDRISTALRAFKGAEHRLERVAEIDGVRYINDSIATSPDRTIAALNAFDAPVLLIAGGYDKGIPFDPLGPAVAQRVRHLFLIGATADQIAEVVERQGPSPAIHRCASLSDAVEAAASFAARGDVVLLSPACASYDTFRNFEERGRQFKELVKSLCPTPSSAPPATSTTARPPSSAP
ncbi:MAG: UDP-N-acetylmuramoyl-L-alanine--D-glutamate ligase [Candidatus Latescibacteria bacterium]|nr:UDP-N-acetylmuramoyl-L-alanine--D-glutamate ligase [Candidatus Latescibacterota bacterium]